MSSTKWTIFWKNLGVKTLKRSRTIKNYNPKNDFAALKRIGVDKELAKDIYNRASEYGDRLFFYKFYRFFSKDPKTIVQWINGDSPSDAFLKIFNLIDKEPIEKSKKLLSELDLIFKFTKKGEGRIFLAKYDGKEDLNFDPKSLIKRLNRFDENSQYKDYAGAQLGSDRIIGIQKTNQIGEPVYKFIKLTKDGANLKISLSMDTAREYNLAKMALEKWFNIFIDTKESKKDFTKLESFLIEGESKHFLLTGVTYFDNEFKLTVSDSYNRPTNVSNLRSYKNKILKSSKKEELISQIRIFYKDRSLNTPITVSFLSHKTSRIVGAVKFVPIVRNLNSEMRRNLYNDFIKDFKVPLNEFLTYKDLDEIGIYKYFLEGNPQRNGQIELRSKLGMELYQSLLANKLLSSSSLSEEQTRLCINKNCINYYKATWDQKHCKICGQILINGKKVITNKINESDVVDYIQLVYKHGLVKKLSNKLLTRNLFIAEIKFEDGIAELIPITSDLKDYQIEVLKFRYPNLIIITSMDNVDDLTSFGLRAIRLYELVHSCKRGNSRIITDFFKHASAQQMNHARNLCNISVQRFADNIFYKDKNKISKYLGAELFEADCATLLNYVFGNCVWLGAKYKGHSVPDGFTAFPLHVNRGGCFIWDTKFGEGAKLHMGKFTKNRTYIKAAKANKSIRENGGLKSFVFISNVKFPKTFLSKYLPLVKGTRMKVVFLSSAQLQQITEHFRKYEKLISNNSYAKGIFLNAMVEVFFKTREGNKCEIIEDSLINSIISANQREFKEIKAGQSLSYKR